MSTNPSTQTSPKKYDLEERTLKFSKLTHQYVRALLKDIVNAEIAKQLVRSAGSIGSNYIEANESLSRKDFFHRIKISRKEAKETRYWLSLSEPSPEFIKQKEELIQEATELMRIFGAIGGKEF